MNKKAINIFCIPILEKRGEDMEALSEYERKRLENIHRNQLVLQSLSIPSLPLGATTDGAAKRDSASSAKKRRSTTPTLVDTVHELSTRRTSARLQSKASGETAAKMSVADELALYRHLTPPEPKRSRPPRALGNIAFTPETGGPDQMKQLFGELVNYRKAPRLTMSGARGYRIDGEFSVAKVTEDRVYSMAVHPSRERIIVSSGSKMGAFGIWDATEAWRGGATSRRTFHFRPHTGSITCQRYNPANSNQLLMSSYDGLLRCLDVELGEFVELYRSPDDSEQLITALDVGVDGHIIYFSDYDGVITRIDLRAKKGSNSTVFQLHEKKAGGCSWSPVDPNYLATCSLDDTVAIWDTRQLKPLKSDMVARFEYSRAVTSVQFHPTMREALISTCYDDAVRIHTKFLSPGDHEVQQLVIKHNNQTGRWITPFRAIWDPKSGAQAELSHLVIGNMNRGLDVIEMAGGIVTNSLSELLTAQPAANAIHPSLDLIVSGTASGKCILWKPY